VCGSTTAGVLHIRSKPDPSQAQDDVPYAGILQQKKRASEDARPENTSED
jgi:hypothetical protein